MNRAEQKLVLELCRCHNPNTKQIENLKKQGVDEAVVLGQLLFHRVAGTAYMTLSNTGLLSLFHREFRTTLKAMNQSACEQITSFRKAVEDIADVLNETHVPYALLKGGRLCYSYPLGCRTSNDVESIALAAVNRLGEKLSLKNEIIIEKVKCLLASIQLRIRHV